MAESKYKVGDIVTIKKKREGMSYDYMLSFTDTMVEKHGGKSYKISRVSKLLEGPSSNPIPDDGYKYELEGIGFNWASSMFEDSPKRLSTGTFVRKKKRPKLDFHL